MKTKYGAPNPGSLRKFFWEKDFLPEVGKIKGVTWTHGDDVWLL